jgi:hypothetical protein
MTRTLKPSSVVLAAAPLAAGCSTPMTEQDVGAVTGALLGGDTRDADHAPSTETTS